MDIYNLLKVIVFGIVEGITEWLPISSTGHLILVNEFLNLNLSDDFIEMFNVVIQLGAILAVIVIYFSALWPFKLNKGVKFDKEKLQLWGKILVASIPAGIIGVLFDDKIDEYFFNAYVVSAMLIVYGVLFIIIENKNHGKSFKINNLSEITIRTAFLIGIFQMLALIPGTSRSGATIIGAMLIGTARTPAAEFTFFLAIPAMLGASLLKIMKFGMNFTTAETLYLLIGMLVAYIVSVFVIKFLMAFIKKHDFKPFGVYRIILGIAVFAYFIFI